MFGVPSNPLFFDEALQILVDGVGRFAQSGGPFASRAFPGEKRLQLQVAVFLVIFHKSSSACEALENAPGGLSSRKMTVGCKSPASV
ncbi:hypothetical protein GL4_1931 [Methyloceanibacter caenitepidi]|uniref:Uncharacterized protein n=1 Tax=Methyloceanibacter caenitepidi TaxID=1384459 RepID=A0A0A8K4E9_9HYPH|nr:hypothetical protein GL4_1931 [Methyloceanibacter caenitepidi]